MSSPWMKIPLADYEGHMSLPQVAQAALLADLFSLVLERYLPVSVAVLGCAGGKSFDRINPAVTRRTGPRSRLHCLSRRRQVLLQQAGRRQPGRRTQLSGCRQWLLW